MKQRIIDYLKRYIGLNRAIAYTVLARGLQIIGSTGTVLLIVHFLSPVEQGYYYTLLSLVALQTIFELGFSLVILQMAAHESVHLTFHADGRIEGDASAHARLASVLKKTAKWYAGAGVVLMLTLLPFGTQFFSKYSHANGQVSWFGPWMFAVIATSAMFTLNPFFSFLEGCGQVQEVAGMRLAQGILAIAMPWTALMLRHGLYAPGAVNTGFTLVGAVFLWSRRQLLIRLLRHETGTNTVSWRNEIWPFQWKIGVSFLCSYFTVQVFTLILFAYRSPSEAGRLGMSMSICGYLWSVVIPWVSTKATPFGNLIARSQFEELDRIFFRTLKQSLLVLGGLVLVCLAGIEGLRAFAPKLASRMVAPNLFALLLLTSVSTFIVQSQAVYLRAHKSEPFLWQSIVVAILTLLCALASVPRWGTVAAVVTYFACTGAVGLAISSAIFRRQRAARAENSAVMTAVTN